MIKRLLSFLYGIVIFWVGYALMCGAVFGVSPSEMALLCAEGVESFYRALAACLAPVIAMVLLLSRLPLVKRLWANLGCALCAGALLLLCLILLGGGMLGGPGTAITV